MASFFFLRVCNYERYKDNKSGNLKISLSRFSTKNKNEGVNCNPQSRQNNPTGEKKSGETGVCINKVTGKKYALRQHIRCELGESLEAEDIHEAGKPIRISKHEERGKERKREREGESPSLSHMSNGHHTVPRQRQMLTFLQPGNGEKGCDCHVGSKWFRACSSFPNYV